MYTSEDIQLRSFTNKDISMRVAELGEGPVVLLIHGWPESWYSWRHQIVALANAGYKAVAPDMPGYGGSDKLPTTDDYHIVNLAGYVVGVLDDLKTSSGILIGHDWGAGIAWCTAQLHPTRFDKLVTLSVPHIKRPPAAPMSIYRKVFGENFFYQLYFQDEGVAEAEFDARPETLLRRLYTSPDTARETPKIVDAKANAGGFIDRYGEITDSPAWLSDTDLKYYVDQFKQAGFAGGMSYYRNIDKNWLLMEPYAETLIEIPTLFMAGDKDIVINGMMADGPDAEKLTSDMRERVPNIEDVILLPNIGHWIQQEAPEEVNKAILNFL